jgi:hypothetical protein
MVLNDSAVPAVMSIQSDPMSLNGLSVNNSGFVSLNPMDSTLPLHIGEFTELLDRQPVFGK